MIRKLLVVGAVTAGVIALGAGPAFAHVEIEREGEAGSDGIVHATLTVPNEEANASTVKLDLIFPGTPAITAAEPAPVAGWTPSVQKSASGDVTQITWTGGPLGGDAKVEFPLTLGPVPAGTKTMQFDALQTYDNGDVVRWIEPTPPGGEEPEHPSPVLTVTGKQPVDDDAGEGGGGDVHTTTSTTQDSSSDDGTSTGVIAGIVIAVILVFAIAFWIVFRSRRKSESGAG